MKNLKFLALTLLLASFGHAQTMNDAIKKTDNELYEAATADFKQLITKEPANSKLYFYYGENLFLQDNENLELAHEQWQKGLSIDPACQLNTVGLGKYQWYKGDTTAGRVYFNKALTASKNKNAEVMRQIASVLTNAPKKDLKGAISLLDKAIKIDPNNIENHLIMGDALLFLTPANGSPAIKSYNTARGLDPKSAKALVRTAQLYERARNYQLANEKYMEAQTLDPTYAPAYRLNGDLNLLFDQSKAAIDNYTKYLQLNNSTEARYRYAQALFKGKRYCEATTELEGLEAKGFTNFYTKRMLGYSVYECNDAGTKTPENYKKAMTYLDAFFATAPAERIIGTDYSKKGLILSRMGNDSLALIELQKGADLDTANAGLVYADMAKIYSKKQNYAKVIEIYQKKAKGDYKKLTAAENFDLGKAFYFGPMNYVEADSAFARLTRQSPTYAAGYLWRARSSFKLEDPKNNMWLSKTPYEQYLAALKPEEKSNPAYASTIIESSKYLGDYYVRSTGKDLVKAKEYWGAVRTLDPNDSQAKAFFASPAGK